MKKEHHKHTPKHGHMDNKSNIHVYHIKYCQKAESITQDYNFGIKDGKLNW